ncbi:hypothetical protein MCOR02_004973 [Pyricularia oryzae]|nr:hypothetical protein MCOR02_004973 [Pyricularia oryzae]KAI6464529.1 hypothetical protein MCOR17_005304 [Pyricularia oryzae]
MDEPARLQLLRRRSTRTGWESARRTQSLTVPGDINEGSAYDTADYAITPIEAGLSSDAYLSRKRHSDDVTQRSSLIKLGIMLVFSGVVIWTLVVAVTGSQSSTDAMLAKRLVNCDPAVLAAFLPSNAAIENVTSVQQGGTFGEGKANRWVSADPTGLPALCAVIVNVTSSPSSSYRFGMFLPSSPSSSSEADDKASSGSWNGRLLTTGNGGFGGGIGWLFMAEGARRRFAVIATDTGHNSKSTEVAWALNEPEKRTDWGWRALHGSVEIGRNLTRGFYGEEAKYSYYSGCSTGGRQGLRELQMNPEAFDGVLVGAPAWYTTHLNTYAAKTGQFINQPETPGYIPAEMFSVIGKDVVRQCDADDGVEDGIVSLPDQCVPDLQRIRCDNRAANQSTCVNEAQLEMVNEIYEDWRCDEDSETCPSANPGADPTLLYTALSPGSEGQWAELYNRTEPTAYGLGYVRYFVYGDENWDWKRFDDEQLVRDAMRLDASGAEAVEYDISRFQDRGGKLIMYHGDSDGIVPVRGSNLYYDRTLEAMGEERMDGFFRYFRMPGMHHCLGTSMDAPWNIGAWGQSTAFGTNGTASVPGFEDPDHDALLALVEWVEKGRRVDKLVATTWNTWNNVSTGVRRQRPLCPWPARAVWDGDGDVNAAESWACRVDD